MPITVTARETFSTRLGVVMTMIGVTVGLGNIWRFPYMAGKFGGSAFVLFYLLVVLVIGVPGLMAEWALGRSTRRGTVGAFAAGGLPAGTVVGWFFFLVVTAATAYYSAAIGWVLFHSIAQAGAIVGFDIDAALILPPDSGFVTKRFLLQAGFTAGVIVLCALVLMRGVRAGIERTSRFVTPLVFLMLVTLMVRGLMLDGAGEGLRWFLFKFSPADLTPTVLLAALGQAIFSMSLGGTFMVVYGSYLDERERLGANAIVTGIGDSAAGILAGLAIFPAVFALGIEPASGPALIFSVLPRVFELIGGGAILGMLFFAGLAAAAFLSAVAAFEVLVAGLTDQRSMKRSRAVWTMAAIVLLFAIPPMISMRIFVPWDLTFGSGMQALGALLAVVTVGWSFDRSRALAALGSHGEDVPRWLYLWIRYVVPFAVLAVALWWVQEELLG